MKLIHLILLVMISFSSQALGGTRDPSASDKTHIDYAAKTDYIVKLCGKDDSNRFVCASAVVIKSRWIITAAHVVKDGKEFSVVIKNKKYCVDKVIYHKDFGDNNFGHGDIALGYLDEDSDLDFYPELYTDNNEIGKQAYICGFGLTGTFITGILVGDGHKRAGTNIIDSIDRHLLICGINHGKKTKYEFLIGSGDSGGGLFINNKLAGINSCVLADDGSPNSDYGDESGHTRVSLYVEWIESNIKNEQKE